MTRLPIITAARPSDHSKLLSGPIVLYALLLERHTLLQGHPTRHETFVDTIDSATDQVSHAKYPVSLLSLPFCRWFTGNFTSFQPVQPMFSSISQAVRQISTSLVIAFPIPSLRSFYPDDLCGLLITCATSTTYFWSTNTQRLPRNRMRKQSRIP